MGQYTGSSLIFKTVNTFNRYLMASNTYKAVRTMLNWCRNSAINGFIVRYLSRNSSLKHSLTYRIFSKLFSFFDRLWDKLYSFGIKCGNESRVIFFIKEAFQGSWSFEAYGVLTLFLGIGFGFASILLGTFNALQIILTALSVLISLILFLGKKRWTAYINNSMFWRFVQYIFD